MKSLVFILLIALSYKQAPLSEKELYEYILKKDNGLVQVYDKNDVSIKVLFKPASLMKYDTVGENTSGKTSRLHFIMQIAINHTDLESYTVANGGALDNTINFLSFKLRDYVSLSDGKKEIEPIACVYSRAMPLLPYSSILLTFDKSQTDSSATYYKINFKECGFNIASSGYTFTTENIRNIPALK